MQGADDDYFSDGLTEELIHLLTRIPSLRVVAWSSTSKLRGREADLAGIRRQLRVGSVLRGSVRRTPERVRVTVQLIDSASGDYLWSETYDRGLENVFEMQGEIARAIVQALRLKLTGLPQTETPRRPPNVACYNLCLQGRFHANKRTEEGLRKSVERFEEAILADESCAEAYAGLADAYSLLADYGLMSPAGSRAQGPCRRRTRAGTGSAIRRSERLAGVRAFFVRMALGRGRGALPRGHCRQPGVLARAALVRHGFSGFAGALPGGALRSPRGARSGPAIDDHSRRSGIHAHDLPRLSAGLGRVPRNNRYGPGISIKDTAPWAGCFR